MSLRRDLPRTDECVLPFQFLTEPWEVEDGRRLWVARSVGTGHTAWGATADGAVRCLRREIDQALQIAEERGVSPREWFRSQRPCRTEYVVQYYKHAREQGQRVEETSCYAGRMILSVV